jgi:hypothetical protein
VTKIQPSKYQAGKQAVTMVDVRNAGGRDFSGGDTVEVRLTIPSVGYNSIRKINIDRNATSSVPFFWTAPPSPRSFDITAEVNPARTIVETDYSNNAMTIAAESVLNPNPPFGCDFTRQEWSETRYAGTATRTVTAPDGTSVTVTEAVYRTFDFYAEVSISARLSPSTMKSGYGVECEVTTALRTNYDVPGAVIRLQDVYAYLPTTGYGVAIKLEQAPGSIDRWRFPANPASVIGARVQYVPVDWPDNASFRIGFTGRDGQSPGGSLCATTYAQVMISGNMYEDDYTAPVYR